MYSYNSQASTTSLGVIDAQQAPAYPHVGTSSFNHLLPHISALIVNMTNLNMGKNDIRAYFARLISQNHWRNDLFEEVFMLVLTQMERALSQGSASPESVMEVCVDSVLALSSSDVAYQDQAFFQRLSPQQQNGVSKNAGLLNDLRREMQNVYQYQRPNHQPHMGHYHQPAQMVYDPRTGQYVYPNQGPIQQGPAYGGFSNEPVQHSGAFGVRQHYRQPYQETERVNHGREYDNSRYIKKDDQVPQYTPNRPEEERSWNHRSHGHMNQNRDEGHIRQSDRFHRSQPLTESFEPEVFTSVSITDVISDPIITTSGVSDVNRSKHAQVVSHIVGNNLLPNEQRKFDEAKKEGPDVSVITDISVDIDLNAIVAQFRVDMIKSPGFPITRKYACVPDVVVSMLDTQKYLKEWLSSDNLTNVADNMKFALEVNDVDDTGSKILTLVREVDFILTRHVNDFMKYELEMGATIDCFMEDYPSLHKYVLKKSGGEGLELLEAFDKRLTETLLSELCTKALVDGDDLISRPVGVNIGYIPNNYSITLIPVDRVALDLPSHRDKIILRPVEHKLVHQTMFGLFDSENTENPEDISVDTHVLLTRDGVKYRVGKCFNKDDIYLQLL